MTDTLQFFPSIRRSGKSVWVGKTSVGIKGEKLPFPIVFEVTERRTKKGQELIFPEIESEIKSDMDLERLPIGSLTKNRLILQLGMLTYNMLRINGQQSLKEAELSQLPGSRSKKVSRRRIRTVMQDLINMAGRLIHTGRRWFISFGQLNPFAELWERIDKRLRSPATVLR